MWSRAKRSWYLVVIIVVMLLVVWIGHNRWPLWTGFRSKTLWDWFQLLIIPVVLALGAWWLNRNERQTEREIATKQWKQDQEIAQENRHHATLASYLDQMAMLMLDKGLEESEEGDQVRNMARTWTLTVLRRLGDYHKGELLQFLHEAKLIRFDDTIVNLQSANLEGARLEGVNLQGANLADTDLKGAHLEWAYLGDAHLEGAYLVGANLSQARDVDSAHLKDAYLEGADLRGVKLTSEQRDYARAQGALLDEGDAH